MSTTVVIRPMTRGDIASVATLERAVFSQPWSARVFYDELAMANRSYLVAVGDDDAIIGYGGLLLVEEDAHVTTVAVDPDERRHRLGSRLLLALIDRALDREARHLTLEVRVSNSPARQLYERFGFAPVGRRKNYYEDEDALVMWAIDIDTPQYRDRIETIRGTLEGPT
ncbi:MAG: ribosomal protein S18-alanine N-acetyltransferase [Acidimicrobiia bacterium]